MEIKLDQNEYGFYQISDKPTYHELQKYYAKRYYQSQTGQYQKSYTSSEIKYFENKAALCERTISRYGNKIESLFEVGCGEGFFANYFKNKKVEDLVLNDITDFALKLFHPHLLTYLKTLNINEHVDNLTEVGKKFDLISMDNVLEHVIDPKFLMENLKSLMHKDSILRVTVPNDFSSFQQFLLRNNFTSQTWVCYPDHLSYFNSKNLIKFCESLGFKVKSTQCDFPIELYLANQHSNYYKDRTLGKAAHLARVKCTNFLICEDIDAYISLTESASKLQYGRDVTIYLSV